MDYVFLPENWAHYLKSRDISAQQSYTLEELIEAEGTNRVFEAPVSHVDADLNIHVKLGGFDAIVPRIEVSNFVGPDGLPKPATSTSRIGQFVQFTVLTVNPICHPPLILLSRKKVAYMASVAALQNLRPGHMVAGTVINVSGDNIFLDIGGSYTAILHKSDLDQLNAPIDEQDIRAGLNMFTYVKRVNRTAGRVSLTRRRLSSFPSYSTNQYLLAQTVIGIPRYAPSGTFIEIAPDVFARTTDKTVPMYNVPRLYDIQYSMNGQYIVSTSDHDAVLDGLEVNDVIDSTTVVSDTPIIKDEQIRAAVSPFAVRQSETVVFESKTNVSSGEKATSQMRLGNIQDIHFAILEIIDCYEFLTSRQIYQLLATKGFVLKNQDALRSKLDVLVKAEAISRCLFHSDNSHSTYRVFLLNAAGRTLLESRGMNCKWAPKLLKTPAFEIKKRLAANQAAIAFRTKASGYVSDTPNPVLAELCVGEGTPSLKTLKISGSHIGFGDADDKLDLLFEVVRREAGWKEALLEKVELLGRFICNPALVSSRYKTTPFLVFMCEDEQHCYAVYQLVDRVLPIQIMPMFTTDLAQLNDSLEDAITYFAVEDGELVNYVFASPLFAQASEKNTSDTTAV